MTARKIPILGQYACGECGRKIEGIFAKLFYIGKPEQDLILPEEGVIRPNVMLCQRHIQYFPIGVINDAPLEDVVNYGLRQSDAILSHLWWNGEEASQPRFDQRPPKGYVRAKAFRICDMEDYDFLSDAHVREFFPNAVKLIDNYNLIKDKRYDPSRLDS